MSTVTETVNGSQARPGNVISKCLLVETNPPHSHSFIWSPGSESSHNYLKLCCSVLISTKLKRWIQIAITSMSSPFLWVDCNFHPQFSLKPPHLSSVRHLLSVSKKNIQYTGGVSWKRVNSKFMNDPQFQPKSVFFYAKYFVFTVSHHFHEQ